MGVAAIECTVFTGIAVFHGVLATLTLSPLFYILVLYALMQV